MKTVKLQDLQKKLQEDMPAVYLHEDVRYGGMGVTLEARFFARADYMYLPDNEEHIKQYLQILTEQMRIHAIRGLGLQPRLDAYEKEAFQIRESNRLLESQSKAAKEKIGELELTIKELEFTIEKLVNPIEDL